jgi:hypothetical protein
MLFSQAEDGSGVFDEQYALPSERGDGSGVER